MKSAAVFASLLLFVGQAQAVSVPDSVAPESRGPKHSEEWRRKFRDSETTQLFRLIGKNAIWTQVATVATDFANFHTQGLVKVGDVFYVSAVEVLESTVRNGAATDSLYDFTIDRSTGAGRGWLFKFDATGHLLGKVELTNGTKYHPGGIDFDGRHLWISVAEYRPNSQTDIYRVDPRTLEAQRIFSAKDHIGGIVHNVHAGTLHGVSWGSRRLYTWEVSKRGGRPRVLSSDWIPNPQFYVDYQDCHYQGIEYMLCGGVGGYSSPLGNFAFGGIDLVDLRTGRMEHQVPVNRFIDEGNGPNAGLSLSHNAFWLEPLGNGKMRGYFMTESDNQAELLIYDITPWVNRQ